MAARRFGICVGKPPTFVSLEGHSRDVFYASFSPEGTHLVTASNDNTARVWDLRAERPTSVALEGLNVVSAAFSPDGTRVVTVSVNGAARVWRVFPDVNELIGIVRASLSRCLSRSQRDAYGLATTETTSEEDRTFIPPPTPDGRCPG